MITYILIVITSIIFTLIVIEVKAVIKAKKEMRDRRIQLVDNFVDKKSFPPNMYPDGTEAQEALNFLSKVILGENYYVVDSMPESQTNTIIAVEIAKEYIRK